MNPRTLGLRLPPRVAELFEEIDGIGLIDGYRRNDTPSVPTVVNYYLTPGPGGYALIIEREDDRLPLRLTGRSVVIETRYLNEVIEALIQKAQQPTSQEPPVA